MPGEPKLPFTLDRGTYLALKSAARELIESFGVQKFAASLVRVEQPDLSDYGNANLLSRFMPIDVVADLESRNGPVVTRELARLTDHVLVPLPAIAATRGPLGRITAQALKEVSDVFGKLGDFLEDGTVTAVEGAQLDSEIDEAIEKLLALKAQVDFEAGRGGK